MGNLLQLFQFWTKRLDTGGRPEERVEGIACLAASRNCVFYPRLQAFDDDYMVLVTSDMHERVCATAEETPQIQIEHLMEIGAEHQVHL